MDLAAAIEQYGYPAVFLGALLEGETVVALAALAGFLGDQLFFAVGRRFGPKLQARFPRLATGVAHAERLLGIGAWLFSARRR